MTEKYKKYNHNGSTIKECTGVNAHDIGKKAADLFPEDGEVTSEYIETLETTMSARELAVLAAMFIHKINLDSIEEDNPNVQVMKLNSKDLPPEILKIIKQKIKTIEENGQDPNCDCEKCVAVREEEMKASHEDSEDQVERFYMGEAGDA